MTDLLQQLHDRLDPLGAVSKKMFGGVCFMLNGNMVAGTAKQGLLVRVGREFDVQAAERDDCRPMEMSGKVMAGYWFIDADVDVAGLAFWIGQALRHNATLPAK